MTAKTPELNRLYQAAWRKRQSPEKRKEIDRKKYLKDKEGYRRRGKQWMKENPHKAQASTHQTTVKTKYPELFKDTDIETKALGDWLKEKRNCPCPYCGMEATHIDHIMPLSKGGPHRWENIEMICKTCNMAKGNLSKEEFITWIKNLSVYIELFGK